MNIWCFDKQNNITPVHKLEDAKKQQFVWINFNADEFSDHLSSIENIFDIKIYDRHVDDCLNQQHPFSFESVQDYYILIFRTIADKSETKIIDTNPIAFIASENLLITIDQNDPAIIRTEKRLGKIRYKNKITAEIIIHMILNSIIDNYLSLRTPLANQFDQWENILLHSNKQLSNWSDFLDFKSNIRLLMTLCEDQEDVIAQWRDEVVTDKDELLAVKIKDLLEHSKRIVRHTNRLENDLESLIQLYYFVIGQRTNEIMRVLTVISCIFMPLTLITGIFGMNFQYMKILTNVYGYQLTLLSMMTIAILLLIIFRWRKWI